MTRIEMVRNALQQTQDASAVDLAAFIERNYGERIDPKYIPVFRASIKDKAKLESARQAARAAAQQAAVKAAKEVPAV